MEPQDLARDPRGLVAFVLGAVAPDRPAGVADGEELLGLATDVVGDDRVGRVEDRLGGAEVLLEHDRGHVGERPLELQDVADVGAAPAVDRLVRVADDGDIAVGLAEQLDDLVLGVVGVLELVDEDVPEARLVGLAHVGVGLQQVGGDHEQVVEVHGVGSVQSVLVLRVNVGDALAEGIGPLTRLFPERLEVDQLRLGLADDALYRARRQPLLVVAELGGDHLDQASRVAVVVDREARAEAQPVGVGPQHAQAGRVEGRDPHLVGGRPDELDHPGPHLVGRLVGKGDGQDPPRRRVTGRHQVRDAPGEHACLARAGPGDDQQRSAAVLHRGPLGERQVVDQGSGPPRERARRSRRAPPPSAVRRRSASSGEDLLVGRRNRRSSRSDTLVGGVEELAVARRGRRRAPAHSHSMVPGGFDVTSSATRFTPSTSLMTREAMRSTKS